MDNNVTSSDAFDEQRDSNGHCMGKKRKRVLEFNLEGNEVQTCGQHCEVGGADPATAAQPTCQTDQGIVRPIVEKVVVFPRSAINTQSCYTRKECEPGASQGHSTTTTTRASVLPSETNKCVTIANGVDNVPVHQFFLPSDDESDSAAPESCAESNEQNENEESTPPLGLESGKFREAPVPRIATAPAKTGVKFCGPHHVFTVVPVGSGELRPDSKEPQTCAVVPDPAAGTDSKQVHESKSQIFPTGVHYSPYSTVKASTLGHRLAYSPYHSIVRGGQIPAAYNPYHTITGLEPTTYQRSETGLRRVSTSKREYGVGGSSVPPSLVNVALVPAAGASPFSSRVSVGATGAPTLSGLHRARTMPCKTLRMFPEEAAQASPVDSEGHLPSEHPTVQSINQMTICSAGGLSIDVGSTDGKNVKIHGAVESPEQLPLLPSSLESGKADAAMKEESRQTWENKAQFVLACIGNAVGLGNMWRFPYLCYKSGGGAFLVPYFLMLFVCGIPLLLMEVTVGQYTRRGPIAAMGKICPLFKGAGVGTVVISFLLSTYYNVILAWAIYYLVQSFYSELPWTSCNTTWAMNCFDDYGPNVTAPEGMKSVTEEFFDEVVLEKTGGIHEFGELRLELLLALFVAWMLVYFALWKSVKSSGRVVYVTATLPYLLIGGFVWRALTLPGASRGLQYFFTPRWELLTDAEVWINAAAQNFNSIGIAFGSMIAFSSYNKFNNNIVSDTWAITLTNSLTSVLAGTIVFSTLGNIALEQGKEIDDVVAEGPGLVFVVYPQALAKMPYANVWAVLFFTLLLILGVDSQFATVEVIVTSLKDAFPNWIKKYLRRHEFLVLAVCTVSFLLGIPNIMQGGIYFFTLIDYYTAAISLMYLAFFEVVAIVWVYGADRLARNVQEMTGRMPSLYFRFCWYLAAPILILTIWIFSMVDYKRPSYNNGEYAYPDWAIGIGWLFASCSIIPIPVFAVIAIINAKGTTLWEKMKNSIRSPIEDCSCCGSTINCLHEAHNHSSNQNKVKLVVYTPHSSNDAITAGKVNQVKETEMNGENVI